jgi:hypothetical protein
MRSFALAALSVGAAAAGRHHVTIEQFRESREARQMPEPAFREAIRASTHPSSRDGSSSLPADWECGWRALAFSYSSVLQPWLSAQSSKNVFDSLELATLCNQTFAAPATAGVVPNPAAVTAPPSPPSSTLYVDPVNGNDSNPGTEASPLQHVAVAVRLARAVPAPATVVLRGGVHRLTETLALTAADNGLTIMGYAGETAVVSGGQVVSPTWQPYNVTGNNNTWASYSGIDAMYDDYPDPHVFSAGAMPSWQACEAYCVNAPPASPCNAYIWYDPAGNFGPEWDGICFGRTDTAWVPTKQNFSYSGHRVVPPNIYVATNVALPSFAGTDDEFVLSLLYSPDGGVSTRRATRARYPNADPELDQYPVGWTNDGTKQPGVLNMNTSVTTVPLPENYPANGQATMFTNYLWGQGGPCSRFKTGSSYWCQPGGRTAAASYFVNSPAGVVADASVLPNGGSSGYASDVVGNRAVMQWWRNGHWFTLAARVSGYTPSNSTVTLGWGGFQGSEGDATGEAWYLEHIFEELDSPNEFFFDLKTNSLYYFHNATAGTPPPTTWTWEVPVLTQLISITGDVGTTPAANITITGLTFTSAAPAYLVEGSQPSGGDWGLARTGAVFLEGTEGVVVSNNLFTRVDGNAVFISGYNRGATVYGNEFVWIGNSAIASWGYTVDVDATAGNQPWFNNITANVCHEIGHFQKQSVSEAGEREGEVKGQGAKGGKGRGGGCFRSILIVRLTPPLSSPLLLSPSELLLPGGDVRHHAGRQHLLQRPPSPHQRQRRPPRRRLHPHHPQPRLQLVPRVPGPWSLQQVRRLRDEARRALEGEGRRPSDFPTLNRPLIPSPPPPFPLSPPPPIPTQPPIISWDRVPYIGNAQWAGGQPTVYLDFYEIAYNFMVANYGANGGAVDNDDGSSRYTTHHNFFVYGGHKSDFDGHQKTSHNNIMAYSEVYGERCLLVGNMPVEGYSPDGIPFSEGFYNNTCILASANDEVSSRRNGRGGGDRCVVCVCLCVCGALAPSFPPILPTPPPPPTPSPFPLARSTSTSAAATPPTRPPAT